MTNTKISFFVDIVEDNIVSNKILDFFKQTHKIDDVFVFTKDLLSSSINSNLAVLSLYHFKFYKGVVIFFSLEDYMEYKDYGLNTKCYLYIHPKAIEDLNSVNRNMLKDIPMLVLNPSTQLIETLEMRSI